MKNIKGEGWKEERVGGERKGEVYLGEETSFGKEKKSKEKVREGRKKKEGQGRKENKRKGRRMDEMAIK